MNTDWPDLIQRHLAGDLGNEETQSLEDALKADAALRDLFLDHANLDCALAAIAESQAARTVKEVAGRPWSAARSQRRFPWPQFAAAACLVAAALWWLSLPPRIVEVMKVEGEVRWSRGDASEVQRVQQGERLAAGTFVAADEDALLRLRFADGTRLELCGPMDVRVSENGQKVIHLEKGALTAEVTPQPPGHPMRVLSATAEVEVVGTVFSLDTLETTTRLQVAEGKVRLRRVADGHVTEVAAQHSVVASASAVEALNPVIPAAAPEEWSLANVPHGEIVEGTIQPSDVSGPFRLVGTAPPRFHPKLQKFLLLSRVVVKSHLPKSQMLATVKEDSELEVRWRTRTHATMECMLSMRKPQGGYGGAFYCRSNGRERPDTDGWYSMRVPLREFKPSTTGEETSAVGSEVRTMVVAAITPDWHDAGIEVAELRIFRPEEKKD